MFRIIPGLLVMISSAIVSTSAYAHPFAVTVADVEYNAEERHFEVAIRLYPEQLEQALSKVAGQPVSLERTADIDKQIAHYLSEHFAIRSSKSVAKDVSPKASGTATTIRWVGKEVSVKDVWLYFTIQAEGSLEGLVLKNSIFTEINPEQLNTVHFTDYKRAASCTLSKSNTEALVQWRQRSKANPSGRENGLKF